MFVYSPDSAAPVNYGGEDADPARNYGSDAAQAFLSRYGAKEITRLEGPDSIGCYMVTFDSGLQLEISKAEQTASALANILPGTSLHSRANVLAWCRAALRENTARKAAAKAALPA